MRHVIMAERNWSVSKSESNCYGEMKLHTSQSEKTAKVLFRDIGLLGPSIKHN
jgi:hypothetical protein